MLEHIITASTKPDAVILDCFMGSGATGEAALRLGRGFVGIDLDEKWYNASVKRLAIPQAEQGKLL
jgi:site-specific DNA-methyltransferase (adenine-specific)